MLELSLHDSHEPETLGTDPILSTLLRNHGLMAGGPLVFQLAVVLHGDASVDEQVDPESGAWASNGDLQVEVVRSFSHNGPQSRFARGLRARVRQCHCPAGGTDATSEASGRDDVSEICPGAQRSLEGMIHGHEPADHAESGRGLAKREREAGGLQAVNFNHRVARPKDVPMDGCVTATALARIGNMNLGPRDAELSPAMSMGPG